jgi:lysylphosphatidylglycerol synthetase-like protein (DUF2156 family)
MNVRSVLVVIPMITLVAATAATLLQYSYAAIEDGAQRTSTKAIEDGAQRTSTKAPMVTSGDNLYIVWWTNKSGNWEVMFRASNDAGQTIGDKINLSNSSESDSQNAEIVASGNNVYVSWWETSTNPANKTSESVLRISTDNGNTFGPILILGNNGTLTGRGG